MQINLSSKNLFWSLLNLALVLGLLFGLKFLFLGGVKVDHARTITVSGEGKTTVIPDIARISFGVVTEGKNPRTIQEENAEKMNQAIEFVKSEGIKSEDIKTTNYGLAPIYDYGPIILGGERRNPFITGYRLEQTVMVKVRDFSKISVILGALPGLGINQINEVSFDVDEPDVYLNVARAEAFTEAREKAETMARMNGVRIRKVVTFSEGFGGVPRYYALESSLGKGGAPDAPPVPQIEPGSQEVTVQVSVTYEIR